MSNLIVNRIMVVGATSAIALQCARAWAARGASLFLVARNPVKLAAVQADLVARGAPSAVIVGVQVDLDDLAAHASLCQQAEESLGGLDAVLIAHGTLPDQGACEKDVSYALCHVHTNGVSAVSLASHAAGYFEPKRRGCIAVITSVAGMRGRQSNYVYGAAKGLVIHFLQGLRNRLARSGVAVVDIRPGFVDTPMTAQFDKSGPLWATPEQVARGIVRAIDRGADVVYLPWFWRAIMLVILHMPGTSFQTNETLVSMDLVLFDFDGTLTRRDTLMPFLRQVAGTGAFAAGLLCVSPPLAAYLLKLMPNDVAKQHVLRHFLAGRHLEDLALQGRQFAEHALPGMLRGDTMAVLQGHVERGQTCVLVSASLDLYLKPWALATGFSDVICSSLEKDEQGKATGRLHGNNCFGPEKAKRVEQWLAGRLPARVTAYGDSRGDREMLAMADHAVWV